MSAVLKVVSGSYQHSEGQGSSTGSTNIHEMKAPPKNPSAARWWRRINCILLNLLEKYQEAR